MVTFFSRLLNDPVLVLYAVALTLAGFLMAAEAGWSLLARKKLYRFSDTLANLALYAGYFAINLFWVQFVYRAYVFAYAHRIVEIGTGTWHTGAGDLWWEWPLLFVLEDFCFYAFHWAGHFIRVFWASHVNHHSSRCYNLSVAFRQTWTPFVALPFWLPLPLLGFSPLMVMTMQTASLFYQSLLHTQLVPGLGPLEWVFNTPRHHKLHHGENAPYLNTNMGGVLIVWDRLFGTFAKESEPVRYGIGEEISSNPVTIAFHEWRALGKDLLGSRSLREVWGYLFKEPGWKPARNPAPGHF